MRIPLYGKILGWFLLNVAIVGAVFWVFFRAQFPDAVEGLLLGPASARIDSMSRFLNAELEARPEREWAALLERAGQAYGAKLYLVARDHWYPAAPTDLPEEIRRATEEPPAPPGFPHPDFRDHPGLQSPPPPQAPPPPMRPKPGRQLVKADGKYWVLSGLPPGKGRGWRMLVIETPSLLSGGLFLDAKPWLGIGAAALGFSLLFWLPLVGSITRAISRLRQAARQIAEGRFDVRVPAGRGDELGELAGSINDMTARLEGFVNGQKRFLGDVAHELCSPLARMEVALGILEQKVAATERASLADVQEELRAMSTLAAELLEFSKASLQVKPLETVELLPLVKTVACRERVEDVKTHVPKDCRVRGRQELLERALGNLLRNAKQYGGEDITVAAQARGTEVLFTVMDSGQGVPDASLPQIFDPFYRPDTARTREDGGTGLGLAIVKTCVEVCGGTVSASNLEKGGFCVVMRLVPAG